MVDISGSKIETTIQQQYPNQKQYCNIESLCDIISNALSESARISYKQVINILLVCCMWWWCLGKGAIKGDVVFWVLLTLFPTNVWRWPVSRNAMRKCLWEMPVLFSFIILGAVVFLEVALLTRPGFWNYFGACKLIDDKTCSVVSIMNRSKKKSKACSSMTSVKLN